MAPLATRLGDLAGLLRDRSQEGRDALLEGVTSLYLEGADDCDAATREGFGQLIASIANAASITAQHELMMRLAEVAEPPTSLVEFVLTQSADVAAPFIAKSNSLTDSTLEVLLEDAAATHVAAVAAREGLTSALVQKVLSTNKPDALAALAGNEDAPLLRRDYMPLLEMASSHLPLQTALAHRLNMPADVITLLPWHVGARLARQVIDRALDVDPNAFRLAIETAYAAQITTARADAHSEEAVTFAREKKARHELKEPVIVRLLRDGDMDRFFACLDELTGIERPLGGALVEEANGYALMVACRAAGFARSTTSTLVRSLQPELAQDATRTFDLMSALEDTNESAAAQLLSYWRVQFAGAAVEDIQHPAETRQVS